jgi:hypothetical protein
MCSGDKLNCAENNTRPNRGKLNTISHQIRQRSLLKSVYMAEGCIGYFNTYDTICFPRATDVTKRGSIQTVTNLIDQRYRYGISCMVSWVWV